MAEKTYIALDLKSFYASVECVQRGLDPLTVNLVVADESRTEKTICLAVSPSLKACGISGRARLFEVVQKVKEVNAARLKKAPRRVFTGASAFPAELEANPSLALDYIVAPPRMAHYIEYSTNIYNVYLRYIAPEDMHVYSIDEVFIDATAYLQTYKLSPQELASKIVRDVLQTTGITAAAGIGTNLYLAKIAMDIQAKRTPRDENGVQMASLDEISYRRLLWNHRPITDFWRIGKGYAKKLAANGMFTMGDVARCSLGKPNAFHNEALLFKLFGINAELLIDHAWGIEPCTMADIKSYVPSTRSIGSGQVLQHPYPFEKAELVVREMTDALSLDLVDKQLVTDQLVLTVGYDIENLKNPAIQAQYHGEITADAYGRTVPKAATGTINLERQTASSKLLLEAVTALFRRIADKNLLVRRLNISANRVVPQGEEKASPSFEQLDLFTDYEAKQAAEKAAQKALEKERRMQQAVLAIKKKHGKNAILKGMNLAEGATAQDRNKQIGGHKE